MEEALTALLASVASGRRYWVRAPQTVAKPYVVMQVIDTLPSYSMAGQADHIASRVQIDVYADTYGALISTTRAIKAILSGYKGGQIQGAFIASERNLPAADAGEVSQLFRTSIDIMIHHTHA
ncbi:hypothetical protein GCM10007908_03700 [Rhizobium albus]|nr:hypothetical protein GCM10007908_03700 [Rhizobium albus]